MAYRTSPDVARRKALKRRHIIDSAARVFSEKGYGGTSMKDILAAAEVSAGSFYFYFISKDELFGTIYDEMDRLYLNVIKDALGNIFANPVESVCKAITLALWSFQKNRELARIMLIGSAGINPAFERKLAENSKKYIDRIESVFSELHEKGIIDVPDIKISAISFMNSMYAVITEWLGGESINDPVRYAYPLAIHNLRALSMRFSAEEVKTAIDSILSQDYAELVNFINK